MDSDLPTPTPGPPQTSSPVRTRRASSTPNRDSGSSRKWAKHCGCTGPCPAELFGSDDSDCDNFRDDERTQLLRWRLLDNASDIDTDISSGCGAGSCQQSADMVVLMCESDDATKPTSQLPQPPMLLHYLLGF